MNSAEDLGTILKAAAQGHVGFHINEPLQLKQALEKIKRLEFLIDRQDRKLNAIRELAEGE